MNARDLIDKVIATNADMLPLVVVVVRTMAGKETVQLPVTSVYMVDEGKLVIEAAPIRG